MLDLESNNIEDADQATHLGTCPCLWSLTLAANPVCHRNDKHYRRYVVESVPHLVSLDERDDTGLLLASPVLFYQHARLQKNSTAHTE